MTHTIKVSFTNGEEVVTKINGTIDEISNHFAQNNVAAWGCNKPQVKRIEFLESDLLKKYSSYTYLFMDVEDNGLLQ